MTRSSCSRYLSSTSRRPSTQMFTHERSLPRSNICFDYLPRSNICFLSKKNSKHETQLSLIRRTKLSEARVQVFSQNTKYKTQNTKYKIQNTKHKNTKIQKLKTLTHPHVRKGVRVRGGAQLAARPNTHPEQAHSSKLENSHFWSILKLNSNEMLYTTIGKYG